MAEYSKDIDNVIAEERKIKDQLPDHPRFTATRIELDLAIKALREQKKKGLVFWRDLYRNPKITP